MAAGSLRGLRVLVVEDEALIAMLLQDMLEGLECIAVGPAATIGEAEALAAREPFDVALLDVHVDGQPIFAFADGIRARGIPLIIASGSGANTLPEHLRRVVLLPKPYTLPALEQALQQARLQPVT